MRNSIIMTMSLLSIFSTLLPFSASAREGGSFGGGGDPLAVEFVNKGRRLEEFLKHQNISGVKEDGAAFQKWLDYFEKSLDGTDPKITFPEGNTLDCFGAPKVGCSDTTKKTIRIARSGFAGMEFKEKYELIALEIFRFMDVKDRYEKAGKVASYMEAALFDPSDMAMAFGKGVYGSLDLELRNKNPKAKITYWYANTRSWGDTEVYKIFRRSEAEKTSCGIVLYVTKGSPTLESAIDCGHD